jgi:hypothetical protein
MANYFDQFDEQQGNYFDNFDDTVKSAPDRTLGEKAIGVGEAALSTLSGLTTGNLAGMMNMLKIPSANESAQREAEFKRLNPNIPYNALEQKFLEGAKRFTYPPITEAGQEYAENVGDVIQQSGIQGLVGMPLRGATVPKLKTNLSQAQNVTRDAILQNAKKQGFSVLPSQVGAGAFPRALEIASGKFKAEELQGYKNTQATTNSARKYLGLPEDAPLNQATFDALKETYSLPYQTLSALPKTEIRTQTVKSAKTGGVSTTPIYKTGEVLNEELKLAREDARIFQRVLDNDLNPPKNPTEIRQKLQAAKNNVKRLEKEFEILAYRNNMKDLIPELNQARKNIAKVYTIEDATNTELGLVDPKKIGKQLSKGVPLSDEMKTVGEFANAFPKANKFVTEAPNMATIYDLAFASGGALASPFLALAPLARVAGRYGVLSEPFQNRFVNPQYGKQQIPRINKLDLTPLTGLLSFQDNNE